MGKVLKVLQTPESMIYLISESNYTWVYYRNGQRELFSRHLSWFQKSLPTFIRTHKSMLVNPNYVSRVQPPELVSGSGHIVMNNGMNIPISRRRWVYITECMDEEALVEA